MRMTVALVVLASLSVGAAAETATYQYDALGRLVASTLSHGAVVSTSIGYDPAGNRSSYVVGGSGAGAGTGGGGSGGGGGGGGGGAPPTTVTQTVTIGVCDSTTVDVQAGGDSDPGGHYPLVVTSASVTAGSNVINGGTSSGSSVAVGSQGNIRGNGQITYTIQNSVGASATGVLAVRVVAGSGCS